MPPITRDLLLDFLNDTLPDAEMAAVEKALRTDAAAWKLFEEVQKESDRGEHTVGAIWRREKLSCPTRDQLGGYLIQAIDPDHGDYIAFHLNVIGCSVCSANVDDLRQKQADAATTTTRRKRIVQSGTGALKGANRRA